jgi:hypothetical protein
MAPLNLSLRALCMPITSATDSRRPHRLLTRPSRSRALSDTFAGIAPGGVAAFIVAQLLGMLAAVMLGRWLWKAPADSPSPP